MSNILVTGVTAAVFLQCVAYIINSFENEGSYELYMTALLILLIQWVAFLHASGIVFGNQRTEKYYDLTGACTYATCMLLLVSLRCYESHLSIRQTLSSGVIMLWCLRLGRFLYRRICSHGGIDSRFTEAKADLNRFFLFWTMQGIWVYLTSLPALILLSRIDNHIAITALDYVGLLLYAIGFTIEVTADSQKQRWHQIATNKGRFINSGIWTMLVKLFFGLVSLFFAAADIHRYISGVPLLENAADKKWGHDPAYQAYKDDVPVLFPSLWWKSQARKNE